VDTDLSHHKRALLNLLKQRGIQDRRVLDAMTAVPRDAFVGPGMADVAYQDSPLPIAEGQTISQPYIVALMIEELAGVRFVPLIGEQGWRT